LLSSDVCPFCGTKQPELSKSTGKDEDTDGDGIPDLEEQKFAFLNYRNPSDATMDQDNDGFLNIEEIKAGTNPEDGSEFPPLALLLRVQHVFKRKLPIKLVEIEKNRSDEMNKWDLVFMAPDPRTRREKRITVRVGETLMNRFKVTSAGFDGEGDAAIPYAVVVSEGPEGEEYTMKLNEVVENRRPTVAFINLMSRSKADVQRHMMRMRVFCNEGQEFVLRKLKGGAAQGEAPAPRGGSEAVVEHYRVIAADVSAKTCQIAMLDAKGGNAVRTFDIPVFDINNGKDFLPEENKREGEMNEPSAEGAAPRPARGRPRPR
jgi:predicted RNA-binding protein with TRAM domain